MLKLLELSLRKEGQFSYHAKQFISFQRVLFVPVALSLGDLLDETKLPLAFQCYNITYMKHEIVTVWDSIPTDGLRVSGPLASAEVRVLGVPVSL